MEQQRQQESGHGTHEHREVGRTALRGAVAAMSMSGMRALTTRLGLLAATPPQMITEEHGPRFVRRLSERQREALVIVLHWGYGAGGGAVFGALPARLRLKPSAGPLFGSALWLGFELVLVPTLGLRMRERRSWRDRVVLVADHLLYGAVLSELRTRPRR
ncbi:hypothetical protein [Qaidamihabitans albus]|uniref:hypothetical protein n=1 Tax=Qaidamihabitans albus TaxID=2795733 RepID=UPI0018F216A3|nr:hypothetical protein [Qaidamihabitans albus]